MGHDSTSALVMVLSAMSATFWVARITAQFDLRRTLSHSFIFEAKTGVERANHASSIISSVGGVERGHR
ncbi:hypothetical protein AGMMS49957_18980 [Synergistales bacterium]|nr:hypothetical protein AGMMS49957_18980 [Synergistales bacterium]